jgi:translation elongation factor EF-G
MSLDLTRYTIKTPEDHVGDVTAELVRRGAWLDGLDRSESEEEILMIRARVPKGRMDGFGAWLTRNTRGIGTFTEISDATAP